MNQYSFEAEHQYQGKPTRGSGGGNRGACPACNGSNCCVQYATGAWCFKCGERVGESTGTAAPRDDSPKAVSQRGRKIDEILANASYAQRGDFVDTYLRSRGIVLESFPRDLFCHPALEYWHKPHGAQRSELIGTFPAMLAAIRDPKGEPVSLHRTYLKADGCGKLFTKGDPYPSKKFMSFIRSDAGRGSAIRLGEAAETMAVAEGIETGLAVMQMTGKPTWVARCADSLVEIELPSMVREIWIAADNDLHGKGIACARNLERRLQMQERAVKISMPKTTGWDWLDVLVNGGDK